MDKDMGTKPIRYCMSERRRQVKLSSSKALAGKIYDVIIAENGSMGRV
jgi:hypothetical protein